MTEPELKHIGDLLGSNVVLLPIRKGGKAPVIKGWPGIRLEDTKTARYRAQLLNAASVAVLLGEASSGICSIDFDDDDALHAFLESNSALRHTLQTRGQRGGNIWIRVAGERPVAF